MAPASCSEPATIACSGGTLGLRTRLRIVRTDDARRLLAEAGDTLSAAQAKARDKGQAAGTDQPPSVEEAVTIRAKAIENGVETVRTAVIRITSDARQPYWLLA